MGHVRRIVPALSLGAVALSGCWLPLRGPAPTPTITTTSGGVAIQTGIVQASTRLDDDGRYVRGAIGFPRAFNGDDVMVTLYPIDGPGKVGVMDVDARGCTYYILATIVNVPQSDGTYRSHPEFYDGRIKWVAVGH